MTGVEIAGDELKSYALDHHGLVAAVCKDLKLAQRVDERLNKTDPRRVVSAGTAAVRWR